MGSDKSEMAERAVRNVTRKSAKAVYNCYNKVPLEERMKDPLQALIGCGMAKIYYFLDSLGIESFNKCYMDRSRKFTGSEPFDIAIDCLLSVPNLDSKIVEKIRWIEKQLTEE